MISIEKFQNVMANYVESQVTVQLSGWKKLAAETVVGIYISKFPVMINNLNENIMFSSLELVKDGKIDVDCLYEEMRKHFKEPIPVQIPKIGTFTFTKENLDELYDMMTKEF